MPTRDPLSCAVPDLVDVLDAVRESGDGGVFPSRVGTRRYWSLTRHSDVMAAGADARLRSDARLGGVMIDRVPLPMIMASDGREHIERRRAQLPHYSGERLTELDPLCCERTARVIESLPVDEPFDWAERVSMPLACGTLCDLIGLPQSYADRLSRWSRAALVSGGLVDGDRRSARRTLRRFVAMASAGLGGGLLDSLSPRGTMEFHADFLLALVAGSDTTRHTMSAGAVALAADPGLFARLSDDAFRRGFSAEVMRWQTPVSYMRRTAVEDMVLGAAEIRSGDAVLLWYLAANRDPRVVPVGDAFDVDANRGVRHLSFGHGPHRCIGARLAEMQLSALWSAVGSRFSSIEPAGDAVPETTRFMRGWSSVPVVARR